MKTRTKLILAVCATSFLTSLIITIGGAIMVQMKTPFDIFLMKDFTGMKAKRIEFLKAHETEIIKDAFEIDGKRVAKDIVFHWDTVKVEKAGLIKAEPYALSVEVEYVRSGHVWRNLITIKTDVNKLNKYKFEGFDFDFWNTHNRENIVKQEEN